MFHLDSGQFLREISASTCKMHQLFADNVQCVFQSYFSSKQLSASVINDAARTVRENQNSKAVRQAVKQWGESH